MQLNTIIIDDEFHSRESLKNMVNEFCHGVSVIGEAQSAEEATFLLQSQKPDLVFMDIELGDGTAFDVLRSIDHTSFSIVFTTAFDQYAIKAIKFNALDYLLKPIDIDELQDAVEKVKKSIQPRQQQHPNKNLELLISNLRSKDIPTITLSTSDSFEYVKVDQIIHCEASGAYTKFFMKNRAPLLVSKTLKEYEQLLDDHGFFRVHQSHLINLDEIDRYIKSDGGYIILKDGTKVAVSRGKKDAFFAIMQRGRE